MNSGAFKNINCNSLEPYHLMKTHTPNTILTVSTTILAVMINWNGKPFLQKSVATVLNELQDAVGKLLIVDNASTDGSVEFLQNHFPQVNILQTGDNLGGAGGFRAGMRFALAQPNIRYVWLLDNDIFVESDSLAPLLQVLQDNDEIGAVGSQICMYDNPETVQEIGAYYTPWLAALKQHCSGGKRLPSTSLPFEVDYLAACSVLIKKECLEQVGEFGDFFIFYDDVEWGLRAQKVGWHLYAVPASVIRHHYNRIKPVVPWREYYRKRNRLAVIFAYPPLYGRWFASCLYLIFVNYSLLLYRWRGNIPLYRALLCAREDAINGQLGKRNLDNLDPGTQKEVQWCNIDEGSCVLVDIPESAGIALAAIKRLMETCPEKHLRIFVAQHQYLRYFDAPGLEAAPHGKRYDVVIMGKDCRYRTARSGRQIYRFSQGAFSPLAHPWLELFIDWGRRTAAIVIAIAKTPLQGAKMIRRYHDGGNSTFRK